VKFKGTDDDDGVDSVVEYGRRSYLLRGRPAIGRVGRLTLLPSCWFLGSVLIKNI